MLSHSHKAELNLGAQGIAIAISSTFAIVRTTSLDFQLRLNLLLTTLFVLTILTTLFYVFFFLLQALVALTPHGVATTQPRQLWFLVFGYFIIWLR